MRSQAVLDDFIKRQQRTARGVQQYVNVLFVQDLPPPDWRSSYSEGQRLRARILYVDPASKVVYLSLQRHLLNASLHESPPAVGTVFEDARVRRVDPGLGVLLELPGGAGKGQPAAGFAHVSNLTDGRLEKVEKVNDATLRET